MGSFRFRLNAFLWRSGIIKYLIILLLGLAAAGLTLYFTSDRGGEQKKETPSAESVPDVSGSTEKTSETGEMTKASESTEAKTTAGTTKAGLIRLEDGRSVVESVWQDTPGYDWTNLYVLLAETTKTSPFLESGGDPCFFLFTDPASKAPLFLTGLLGDTKEKTELLLYAMDGERLYQLADFNEAPYYSPKDGALVFKDEMAMYTYTPHVLIRDELTELPDDLRTVALVSLTDLCLTSENVESFLVELSGEEASR